MFRIPFAAKVATVSAGAALLTLTATAAAFASSGTDSALAAKSTAAASHDKHKPDGKMDKEQRALIARTVFESEADVLGLKPDQLRDALRHGKTVEELARDRGMNKEQFADRLGANLRPRLAQLVDSHKITQAQADRVLDRIAKGHIPGWERHHKGK
jgi:uncharacterized protein YaiL (DUF2058 family)